jgi:signal transduction histidine kinase
VRARLIAVAVATTTMVALAFVVPLALLVRSVARDRALTAAERDAEALAPVLAVTTDPASVGSAVGRTATGGAGRLTVFLADGRRVGAAAPDDTSLELARRGRAFFAGTRGGTAFFLPVLGASGTSVVRAFVPSALLERGVVRAWTILSVLALVLVAAALAVADRLAASVVRPVRRLADAAHSLGQGDLSARVEPGGPPEVAAVGRAFNLLAGRVGELLEAERELVADLSHRLRTPLTVLRLEADAVPDPHVRERIGEAAAELERAVSQAIEDARRPIRSVAGGPADLGEAVRERAEFWGALAEDQGRAWRAVVEATPAVRPVAVSRPDLDAALDALLGNVFAHTPEGTPFSVTVEPAGTGGWRLVVEDAGPGLPGDGVLERGRSGAGSTGLGLDIARRTAEAAGGRLRLGSSPAGGARIELEFPAPA